MLSLFGAFGVLAAPTNGVPKAASAATPAGTNRVAKAPAQAPLCYGARVPGGSETVGLWTALSGWKIQKAHVAPTNQTRSVSLATAANEAEAVQFVVRPTRACADVRVAATALRNSAGKALPASAIEILRVGYVPIEKTTDGLGKRGLWPDPLPPQDAVALPVAAGENQPFWIRVKPPKGTPAGRYEGTLVTTIRPKDGAEQKLSTPFSVEVFAFEMPDVMSIETSFGFNANIVARYHGLTNDEQRAQVNAAYLKSLSDHHLSPYNPVPGVRWTVTWTNPTDKADIAAELPVFDWTKWDAAMEKALATYHFNTFVIGVDGLREGPATTNGQRVLKFRGVTSDKPAYDVLMGRYLRGIEAHLREKGWLDKAFVYWFDEPKRADYPFVMHGFDVLKRHAPGLRRMLTEEPSKALLGGPNVWCPLTRKFHSKGEGRARKRGDTFWWYICCEPLAPYAGEFIDHPGCEPRLWLWQTWADRVTGVLIWETVYWTSGKAYPDPKHAQNPYEDAMSWSSNYWVKPGKKKPWGNGDGRFLYPPRRAALPSSTPVLEGPVDSVRLEMLRDGIEDYEYFALLRRLLKAKGASLSAADRTRLEALLTVPKTVSRSLTDFAREPEPIEAHRRALARAIETLQ